MFKCNLNSQQGILETKKLLKEVEMLIVINSVYRTITCGIEILSVGRLSMGVCVVCISSCLQVCV